MANALPSTRKRLSRFWRRNWPIVAILGAVVGVLSVLYLADWLSRPERYYSTTNYSQIEDDLYLGGFLAQPPPGTRAVLNVGESADPYQVEVHKHEPIRDGPPAPSLDWLRQQVKFIDEQRRAGLSVYVHCQAGISRSALVMTAYFMFRDKCTRDEALATIRAKRKIIEPNPAFMKLLEEWQVALKGE
jgi:hypothetical protein